MTRTMRRMDSGLPLGGCEPSFPEAVWVNTNAADRVQGFRWLESSRTGLRARCAGSGADFVWPAGGLVRYCGISTADFVAFSAHRGFADCEVLLQGILNLGLLVLATYEIPRGGGPGYFSREFFARRAAAPAASSEPDRTTVFGHLAKPAPVDTAPLLGRWRNSDPAARGLVEITIEDDAGDLAVRAIGSGEEGPVDWGPARTGVFACLDEAGKASLSLLATWDFGFLTSHVEANLKLGVAVLCIYQSFQDASGRHDYFFREFLSADGGAGEMAPAPAVAEASCGLDAELGRGPGAADELLLGHWHNAHHSSRGIPEIALERRGDRVAVRVWGAGAQGLADWGETPGGLFTCVEEDGVRSAAALARYDFGFLECELQIRQNKGILAVTTFNRFRDGSGRSSYFTRELFYRGKGEAG